MKQEIQKILEMNKSGTITDEQAAQLLEELTQSGARADSSGEQDEEARSRKSKDHSGFFSMLKGTMSSALSGVFLSDIQGNSFSMSKVASPSGREYLFKDNSINMSSVEGLRLDESEMTGNSINAAKFDDTALRNAKLKDSGFNGSSVEDLRIEESEVEGLQVSACKFHRVEVKGQSRLAESKFNASSVTDFKVESSSVASLECDRSHIHDVSVQGSQCDDVLFQCLKVHDLRIQKSRFADVLFSGGEGWKKTTLDNVTFEDCHFQKALFSECRIRDCVIKNVDLKEIKVLRVDLNGQTIDGNEEFLALVEKSKN